MREKHDSGAHWLISPYREKKSRSASRITGWKKSRGTWVIKRVFVASGPFVGTCEGTSTEMMDIEGMAASSCTVLH